MMARHKNDAKANTDDDDRPLELPISTNKRPRRPPQPSTEQAAGRPRFIDPRFDPNCSRSEHFAKNYAFVDDLRQEEIQLLKKALRKEKDPSKKDQIRAAISRLNNKIVENRNQQKKLELKKHRAKKSDIKKRLLVDKYRELKDTGKLSKYLERKRKKLISRDEARLNRSCVTD